MNIPNHLSPDNNISLNSAVNMIPSKLMNKLIAPTRSRGFFNLFTCLIRMFSNLSSVILITLMSWVEKTFLTRTSSSCLFSAIIICFFSVEINRNPVWLFRCNTRFDDYL